MQKFNENDYYVVRCRGAGVFAGNIKEKNGNEVTMTNVRRLYFWRGATDCLQLAKDGVSNPGNCKFTVTLDEATFLDVIEINRCTEKAEKSIRGVKVWSV